MVVLGVSGGCAEPVRSTDAGVAPDAAQCTPPDAPRYGQRFDEARGCAAEIIFVACTSSGGGDIQFCVHDLETDRYYRMDDEPPTGERWGGCEPELQDEIFSASNCADRCPVENGTCADDCTKVWGRLIDTDRLCFEDERIVTCQRGPLPEAQEPNDRCLVRRVDGVKLRLTSLLARYLIDFRPCDETELSRVNQSVMPCSDR